MPTPMRVLIVDGNPEDAQALAEPLRARGFTIDVAPDGEAAVAVLERDHPDVVLLEVTMPGGNGMEILDRIRANPHLASTPVVIVTAKTGDDDVLEGYKFGADYYLTKPVTPRRLLRGIGLVLGREFPE
jgi:two-component system alkaline phosphatase synthesis response regulator PhoP